MSSQIIPLDNAPNQSFQATVQVDGQQITLNFKLTFNRSANYWTITILDAQGNLLLDSVPCITGDWPAANILGQYGYLKIGSAYIVNAGNLPIDYPDKESLGSGFVLLWSDTAA